MYHVRYRKEDQSQRMIKAVFGVNAVGQRGVKRAAAEAAAEAAEAKAAKAARVAAREAEAAAEIVARESELVAKRQKIEEALLVDMSGDASVAPPPLTTSGAR